MSIESTKFPRLLRPVPQPAGTVGISREAATTIANRAGSAAVAYYPEIYVDDLTYSLREEISWCLEGVSGLDAEDETILRDALARTIIDPSAHRSKLARMLHILSSEAPIGGAAPKGT